MSTNHRYLKYIDLIVMQWFKDENFFCNLGTVLYLSRLDNGVVKNICPNVERYGASTVDLGYNEGLNSQKVFVKSRIRYTNP